MGKQLDAREDRVSDQALLPHTDFTVPEAMSFIVQRIPDVIAVDDGERRFSYLELYERANQVAHALLEREPDPGAPIALLCGHGAAPPIGLFGVLHAGLIGAPLDAREPLDRLRLLVGASDARFAVVEREHAELARALGLIPVVIEETAGHTMRVPAVEIPDGHPGLVYFTSGSTGTPKGVVGAHRNVVPRARRQGAKRGFPVGNRHALTTSYGFAASEIDLFTAVLNGATLYTYDLRTRGPSAMADWIRGHEIAWMPFVPAGLRALAATVPPGSLGCLRHVGFGGDTLYWPDVELGRRVCGPETMFVNVFGSTEAGHVASLDIPPDMPLGEGPVPVGTPDPEVELRLVDEDDEPVPDGETGAIVVIRHAWLGLGYWNDPELTRRHFFREPDGRRGFRTADSGRWREDGLLEHVARIDSRVKVHGAMVATSEVEVALVSHPDVADAAVVAVPDVTGLRVVAYVVPRAGAALSAWKLRRDLAASLSSTSVPSAFVAVESLPRTIRGKVDRAALPPPPPPVRRRPYRAPLGNERDLAEIFGSVLGLDRVGLDDDFFELGGDSLGVIELLAAIAERFSVDLSASTVLDAPTVAELALRLSHRRPRNASPAVPLRTNADGPTFFCVTGGGGPAISLRALSEAMPDVNFYAVQPRGLEERALPDHSVTAAARRYADAIRDVQPSGPYLLGGFSFGGFVAFETACRLQAAGEEVALLVMLDTPAPGPRRGKRVQRFAGRARAQASELVEAAPADGSAPLARVQRGTTIAGRAARVAAKSAVARAERRWALATAGLLPRPGYHQYDLFLRLSVHMMRGYQPASTFAGPMLLVRGDSSEEPARDLGWSSLVHGPITVVDVPAEHSNAVRKPAVDRVGEAVRAALR